MPVAALLATSLALLVWPIDRRLARLSGLVALGRLPIRVRPGERLRQRVWSRLRVWARPRVRSTLSAIPVWPVALLVAALIGGAVWLRAGPAAAVPLGGVAATVTATVLSVLASGRRSRGIARARDQLERGVALVCAELEAGSSPERACSLVEGSSPALDAAWQVAELTGAPLTEVLGRVRADVAARRDTARQVRAAVAGPASSAVLLALLPLLGAGLGAAMGADPIGVLLGTSAGRLLLCLAAVLDAGGVVWTQRMIQKAVDP